MPKNKTSKRQHFIVNDNTPAMEAYRVLRTNIEFSNSVNGIKTLLMTSSISQEGKSTTCSNLAKVCAYAGKKTLLIDLDLRKPVLHHFFDYENKNGIMDVLLGDITMEDAIKPTDTENLSLLNSGTLPAFPAEILVSPKMTELIDGLRDSFELIIIDTPPAAGLTDAAIAARFSDAVLLVVAAERVNSDALDVSVKNLKDAGANILGIVMNNISSGSHSGYSHYDYYYKYYNK